MYSPLASCKNKHHISLYVWEQSTGKKVQQRGDLKRHDCFPTPTTFRLDVHKHNRNLDKTDLVSVHPT